MSFLALIEAKREGHVLTDAQLREFVSNFTSGRLPDYQVAAFLMAVFFRGMGTAETRALTLAMRDSGHVLKFPADPRPLVDKHSTGGVGDKVSLPLAPLLACLGFRVPMISGRGLGITGGTLDKLDSIPGFQTSLPTERIIEIVQNVGCVICGQTERMVPADKGLYALRDVTGTVPSIPLIVASILSKKLAEGLVALLLDVKFDGAAFMPSLDKAHELAEAMVVLGNECGVRTRALLSRMDVPLGRAAGNWLEVKESVACLEGRRGQNQSAGSTKDLRELVIVCAANLLTQTGKARSLDAGRHLAEECLDSGLPHKKWIEMLQAQGADLEAVNRKLALDHTSPVVLELTAPRAGYISRCDARIIGEIVRDLGGGRVAKDSTLQYDVGVDRLAKPREEVSSGAMLGRVHATDAALAEAARTRLESAFHIASEPPKLERLVAEIVGF